MGLCGGLLLVDTSGRPIEFHCTAPVPPNRAQEILYGCTYEHYLYGETIAKALLDKCSKKPACLVSDQRAVCSIRSLVKTPTVLCQSVDSSESEIAEPSGDPGMVEMNDQDLHPITSDAQQQLFVLKEFVSDAATAVPLLNRFNASCDVDEPFKRIGLAISEAMSGAAA